MRYWLLSGMCLVVGCGQEPGHRDSAAPRVEDCGQAIDLEQVKEQIKSQLPVAASMRAADLERLGQATAVPSIKLAESQSLTVLVLQLNPNHLDLSASDFSAEFRWLTDGIPHIADLLDALQATPGMTTIVQPGAVKELTCELEGDTASGTVHFRLEAFLEIRANYVASLREDKWQLVEFSLPVSQAKTRLDNDGNWKTSGAGVLPALRVDLPSVFPAAPREDVPHRQVLYLQQERGEELKLAHGDSVFAVEGLAGTLAQMRSGGQGDSQLPASAIPLVIRADRLMHTGVLADVLQQCHTAGLVDMRLQVFGELPQQFTYFRPLSEIRLVYREPVEDEREFPPMVVDLRASADGDIARLSLNDLPLDDSEALSRHVLEIIGPDEDSAIRFHFTIVVDASLKYERLAEVLAACGHWIDGEGRTRIRRLETDVVIREAK